MKTTTRILTGVAAVAFAGATALTVSTVADAEESGIAWKPCDDAKDVECASVEVPLDWSQPDGPVIEIGLAKREASDPDNRAGSILMDPGGPGGSGVGYIKQANPLSDKVSKQYDVIGFDPRGVGVSEPVSCDEELSTKADAARNVETEADFAELAEVNQQLYDDCRKRSGAIVEHADNLQTVEDMEAIRQALGEGGLNYLGYSYGSLMGQQYAEKYPDNIRSMVLDGNMDHSITQPWEFARSETAPVEENFGSFAKWCESTKDCALNGKDVEAVYSDLKDKARDGELSDPETGDKVDFFALSDLTFNANLPEAWKDLAATYQSLASGDGEISVRARPAAEVNNVAQAAFCGDYDLPVEDYSDWKSMRDKLSEQFPNVEYSRYMANIAMCVGAPVESDNPQHELEVPEGTSVVMIGNVHDPATVYEWTQAAVKQSGADLVTYEGYGHTIYGADSPSKCINDAIDSYYLDLERPGGVSCPGMEKPGATGKDSDRSLTGPWGR